MNINSIQKHYDKLATVERFKLINAAAARGDDADRLALANSAATKTWKVITMRGYFDAFDFLAAWHVCAMLELDSLYWALLALGEDDQDNIKMPGGDSWLGLMQRIQARALARVDAWVEVCKEYNVDAAQLVEDLPGGASLEMFIAALRELPAVEYDTTPYINDLRAVIAKMGQEWE